MSLILYTLAQVRNGTGWPEGSRFLLVLGNPEAAIAAVSCGWTESEEGVWRSSCGQDWLCAPEGSFRHCPGCGKAIAPAEYFEPPTCPECGEELGCEGGACRECYDSLDDAEPADTGGGYDPVDGDEPEF